MFSRFRVHPACGAVALLALVVACQERSVTAVDVAAIAVMPSTATVTVGETRQFNVEIRDAGGNLLNGRTVAWSVDDPTRARSEGSGVIMGLSPGPTTVRATSGGVTGTAEVTVMEAVSIALSPEAVALSLPQGAAQPATHDVAVTNATGGPLTGLRATIDHASGQPGGWLTATLSSTTAPATLSLSATAGSLAPGTYQAIVTVAAAGDASPSRALPVELSITAALPSIQLGSSSVSFVVDAGAPDPAPQNLQVTNAGGGTLSGLGASVTYASGQPTDWLVATLSPSTAPSTLALAARTSSLVPGTYDATVMISSAVANNSPQTLPVTLTVGTQAPAIALSDPSRAFTATAGGADPASQFVTVSNAGGGALSGLAVAVVYPAGQATDWLEAALPATTAPANLSLQPRTGSLPAGTYTAAVEVRSDVAANSPQTIAVTFQVNPPSAAPAIVVTPDTVTFTATAGGPNPANRDVQVSNGGGGSLGGLAVNISYGSSQTGWLSGTLSSPTAPSTLTLQAAIASLPAGTYTATAQVASSDASISPRDVAVTLIISAAPVAATIGLSPTSVGFTAVAATGNPGSQTVAISNIGGGTLSDLSTQINYTSGQPTGWLAASLSATSAPSTMTLQATTGLLLPGTYTARVEVRSSVASNSPQDVAVTFQVTAPIIPPAIAVNPTSLSFNATVGGANPASKTADISNGGGSTLDDLDFNIQHPSGQSGGWLSASLASKTAPTQLTLAVTTGSLPAGTYNATVEVRSNSASNSPQSIAVTFTVDPAPTSTAPAAPSNLDAENRGTTMVELTWNDNANNETEYRVERSLMPTSFSTIATLPANSTTYRDTGLLRNTRYYYRVLACNAAGCTASNVDDARTN